MKLRDRVVQPPVRVANGGTEITTNKIHEILGDELDGIQIISSRVRDIDPTKKVIYYLHDLPEDPESSHLRELASRNRFNKLVFVSNWQYQRYRDVLGIPYSNQCRVIENGVDPFPESNTRLDPRTNPIKLIYTPTPHRGLEILVPVFEHLATVMDYIELDVYSSFALYGWDERDSVYKELFDKCKSHPKIRYHGSQPQDVVRVAYQSAHIFAYPSIWPETSCRCLIEAMMSGCESVHPNFAALPETAAGTTAMYDGSSNPGEHINIFANKLASVITGFRDPDLWANKVYQNKRAIDNISSIKRFGWNTIASKWRQLIAEIKAEQ